jgi:hypothetical protein
LAGYGCDLGGSAGLRGDAILKDYMNVQQAAKTYASLGWHVLPVKQKVPCGGDGWQFKTTNDAEAAEVLATIGDGIGVQLGPKSGIVDVECDSDEATKQLKDLLGEIPLTPCFRSTRGCHYLFKWNDNWPAKNKAVFKIGAIEFRTGAAKAAQSVFPPSGQREWIVEPTRPVQEFPRMEKIHAIYNENHKRKEFEQISFSSPSYTDGETLDVPRWLSKHGVSIIGRDEIEGVTRWYIDCPGKKHHTTADSVKDCCLTQEPSGKLGGHCFHQSCGMGNWESLRDAIGPLEFSDYHDESGLSEVDLSQILNKIWENESQQNADENDDNEEDFCLAMVPDSGVLRQIFDYYQDNSIRSSNIMGLAVSLSICETIMGRKVASHTDLRTNDYNLIIAQTASGKEACESTVSKIMYAADPSGDLMLPPNVQSGNGLIRAVSEQPCCIWVCDEFGKTLQAVLDKKGNKHLKDIGTNLLTLYGKANSTYGGAAHADGVRNKIVNPHLVLLGLSTGSTVFGHVSAEQVADGLIGRIAFWPVQKRPKRKKRKSIVKPSESLVTAVKSWIDFAPGGNLGAQFPETKTIPMSADALERWDEHEEAIDTKMDSESSARSALWGRVAARAMKYALIHRLARLEVTPQVCEFAFVMVEIQDVNWGIKLANWLAKIACELIEQNTVDTGKAQAKQILLKAVEHGPVNSSDLLRAARGLTAGDFASAAKELGLVTRLEKSGGRPRKYYELSTV